MYYTPSTLIQSSSSTGTHDQWMCYIGLSVILKYFFSFFFATQDLTQFNFHLIHKCYMNLKLLYFPPLSVEHELFVYFFRHAEK